MAALTVPSSIEALHRAAGVPVEFGEVVRCSHERIARGGLAEVVREDIVACGECFEMPPSLARYAPYFAPDEHPEAARETVHQVVLAAGADRVLVVEELAQRHPAWGRLLRQAAVALELLGGHPTDRALPDGVGPRLVDGTARFAIGEVVAVGSHGVIATASDRDPATSGSDPSRSVIVKFLRASAARPVPWTEEAQRAARVQHPCGIRVLWSGGVAPGEDGGARGCVVFERIVGRSLVASRVMEEEIDLERFATELVDLSLALAELHDRGFAHGDISPANVLVDSFGRMRLVDYGLAQPLTPELAALDVARLAELLEWTVRGYLPPDPSAREPRLRAGLRARLLRAARQSRVDPPEATAFAASIADCIERVHFARGLVEVVAGAAILFAVGAILGEALP